MDRKDTTFLKNLSFKNRGKRQTIQYPAIMGILNLTPDSFYDGGKFPSEQKVLERVQVMLKEGADIIDIGAYSSRPGAVDIDLNVEMERIDKFLPVISREFPNAILSIDTFRSPIASMAVSQGASMINDISAGLSDSEMMNTVAGLKVPYVLMHMKGNPGNMQKNPTYKEVETEVLDFLSERVKEAKNSGIKDIIIDPGFGFGKDLEHNYKLLAHLDKLQVIDCPILVGVSRKSMINKLLDTTPEDALNGTTVLNTISLLNGASIIRVHDIKEAKEVVKIVSYYQNI